MLHILIKLDTDSNEITYKHSYNVEEYNIFVKDREKILNIMSSVAKDLCLNKANEFKSLEFIVLDTQHASIIYNDSKYVDIYYNNVSRLFMIKHTDLELNSERLLLAFMLDRIVMDHAMPNE